MDERRKKDQANIPSKGTMQGKEEKNKGKMLGKNCLNGSDKQMTREQIANLARSNDEKTMKNGPPPVQAEAR